MEYKELKDIFGNIAKNNCTLNIFGIYENTDKKYGCVCLKGDINSDLRDDYINNIQNYSEKESEDFSLSDNKVSRYSIGPLELLKNEWEKIKNLISNAKDMNNTSKEQLLRIILLITEFSYKDKKYYIVSKQEKTENFYKKNIIMTIEKECKKIKNGKSISIQNGIDCILDEIQDCFYTFRHNNTIKIFNLIVAMQEYVNNKISEITQWSFLDNVQEIINKKDNKGVCEPLYQILSNENQKRGLNNLTAMQMKSRCLKVSKGKITSNDFNGDKLIITNKNRDYILKLLSGRGRYNIVFDIVE